MSVPTRVQRRRTKGFRLPENTLCCTRPSRWSNPFSGDMAGHWFRRWLVDFSMFSAGAVADTARGLGHDLECDNKRQALTGKKYLKGISDLLQYDHLACYCPTEREQQINPCHVDVIIDLLREAA